VSGLFTKCAGDPDQKDVSRAPPFDELAGQGLKNRFRQCLPRLGRRPILRPVVLYTEDGGNSWVDRLEAIRDQFPLGEWGWKIQFLDSKIGLISLQNYDDGAIITTSDSGMTWTRRPINDAQMNKNLEGIGFVNASHGWVITTC
jgi:hypothetical protein